MLEQFIDRPTAICILWRCGIPPTHSIRRQDHSKHSTIGAIHSIQGDESSLSSESLHPSHAMCCCYGGTCIIGIIGVAKLHRPPLSAGIASDRHGRSSPWRGRVAGCCHREKWTPAGISIVVIVRIIAVVTAVIVVELTLSIASSSSSLLQVLHSRERGRRSSRHRRADGTSDEGSEETPAGDSDGTAGGFGGEGIYFCNVHLHSLVVVVVVVVDSVAVADAGGIVADVDGCPSVGLMTTYSPEILSSTASMTSPRLLSTTSSSPPLSVPVSTSG
mmetsp:Transcript_8314/g.18089  ORF Transcript_8314/g.18089 Transcript_8314/m.18089 type:complete len:275 (+) Transcript_8314:478-1302(+)